MALRGLLVGIGVAIAMCASARAGEACSCLASPLCEIAFRQKAIFVGRVESIEPATRIIDQREIAERVVHFRVLEPVMGVDTGEIDIRTGIGGGDCGYDFRTGVAYLVYASDAGGRLNTGICLPNKPVEDAAADLDYLRSARDRSPALGELTGVATYMADPPNENGPPDRRPLSGIRVTATLGTAMFRATTDATGRYTIRAPVGTYGFTFEVPDGLYAFGPNKLTLIDARGCASADLGFRDDGHVRGEVVDKMGEPMVGVPVELAVPTPGREPLRWLTESGRTDATGHYDIGHLPQGDYIVALTAGSIFNGRGWTGSRRTLAFMPGVVSLDDARRVHVSSGTSTTADRFTVPAGVTFVQVSGQVVDASGQPIAGVKVDLWLARPDIGVTGGSFGVGVVTGEDGTFTMAAVAGDAYIVNAERTITGTNRFDRVRSPTFTAATGAAPFIIRFK